MKTHIVKIGNSQEIRIPKVLLKQCGLSNEVELKVRKKSVIINSAIKIRENWNEAFAEMAKNNDDKLLDRETVFSSEWDKAKWEW